MTETDELTEALDEGARRFPNLSRPQLLLTLWPFCVEPRLPSSMMVYMDRTTHEIVSMPRGGPDASWLDRRLQTDRLEYLDRDDVDDLKRKVIDALDTATVSRCLQVVRPGGA